MHRLRRLVAALLLVLAMMAPGTAVAQPSESAVKAAFLPRFARYVTWPPTAMPRGGDPFFLCVIGSDPFGAMLDDAVRSQSVDGRRIVVRRMDSADGADGCQIAFVQGNRLHSTAQLIGALGNRPILTVTDFGDGARRGIVHFTIFGGRVRFFIDQSSATRRGLNISSRLLALAIGVRQ